jgi:anoctamin-10
MAASKVKNAAQQGNFDVDYVIVYRFADTGEGGKIRNDATFTDSRLEQKSAVAQFEKLIHALSAVGLGTEVRAGDHCSVLIFLKLASERHLNAEVYRSR